MNTTMNKIIKNNTITQKHNIDIILSEVKEMYCDLKISWNLELQNMNIKWKKLFDWKNVQDTVIEAVDLVKILKKYINDRSSELWIESTEIFLELKKPSNSLDKYFKDRLYSYFIKKNWVVTSEMVDSILKWNLSKLWNIAYQVEKKIDETKASKERLSRWQEWLKVKREEQRMEYIRKQNEILKKKDTQPKLIIKSPRQIQIETIVDNLLWDPDVIIDRISDLNNYYDHSSWLDNSQDTLEEIFNTYCDRKNYLGRYELTIELIDNIYKLWISAKEENIQFLNNQHAAKFIKDELFLDCKINQEMIKIFYDWLNKKTP